MATTTTGNLMTSGALSKYVNRKAIEAFHANLKFMGLGLMGRFNKGDNTYSFYLVDKMTGSATTLTQGTTPSSKAFNLTEKNVTKVQSGDFVELTDLVLQGSPVDAMGASASDLGKFVAESVDAKVQDVIDAGTNVIFGGTQTARTALTATDVMTAKKLIEAAQRLKANNAPTLDGSYYVAVVHPDVAYDLMVDASTNGWVDVNKYTNSVENIFKGELGRLAGVRIVESANVQVYADGGASTVDAYPTFVMGANAFGFVVETDPRAIVKGLGAGGTDDPLDQRATVGVKAEYGISLLREDSLYRIETASSIGAN